MKKMLFVSCTNFLENTFSGGKKGSLRNYQMNQAVFGKENVDLLVFGDAVENVEGAIFVPTTTSKFETMMNCFLGRTRGYTKNCENKIIELLLQKKYEYLYLDFSGYGISIPRIKKYSNAKIITFFHNVEKFYEKKRAQNENKLYYISMFAIAIAEKRAIKYSDYIITLNNRDKRLVKETYQRESDVNLPVSFVDKYCEDKRINSKCKGYILFVGADFGPNIDGVRWITQNVMPNVKTRLLIVGKGMEKYRNELNCENVDVVGTVDDLEKYYYEARAVVMPIRYGDGMKVKTAEALMYGKTLIGTTEAFEGYDITDGVEGYYCNSKEEFIYHINNLVGDGFNNESRKLFLNKYDINKSIDNYRNMFE